MLAPLTMLTLLGNIIKKSHLLLDLVFLLVSKEVCLQEALLFSGVFLVRDVSHFSLAAH
jgi:hypothetical protein